MTSPITVFIFLLLLQGCIQAVRAEVHIDLLYTHDKQIRTQLWRHVESVELSRV